MTAPPRRIEQMNVLMTMVGGRTVDRHADFARPISDNRPVVLGLCRRYAAESAITRTGLPLPPTILSGAAMTMAPVGGS